MPDGQAARLGGGEFGVVVEDGGGHDDHGVSLGDVRRIVADVHLDARLAQLLGVAALLEVGAAHAHALVERDASDAAHADAPTPMKCTWSMCMVSIVRPRSL